MEKANKIALKMGIEFQ